ncbi:MAG: RNA methyltransferase [Prevotella sp.]|nr:RNA methyltransferase [Prevotella sp.]
MISKNKQKLLRQLEHKKHRAATGLFVAEGPKVVGDLLAIGPAETLIATEEWIAQHAEAKAKEWISVSDEELHRISFLQHPQQVMATFALPSHEEDTEEAIHHITSELCLALDSVQDPGNLGTIIRIADWFGIQHIYCSYDTADAYSPKVVQATMGSIARVQVNYTDLCQLVDQLPEGTPVYGTVLDGDDLYNTSLTPNGLMVMGNEGKGISSAMASRLTHRLLIPPYPAGRATADSLNVAIATAVCCAEFRRRLNASFIVHRS